MKLMLCIALCSASLLSNVARSETPKPTVETAKAARQTLTWIGEGADENWSTPQNWSPAQVPLKNSAVVFDATSPKNSVWDREFVIASLTVKPSFKGQLLIKEAGEITGNVVLSGKVLIDRDPHHFLPMRGKLVDFSGLTQLSNGNRYRCPLDFAGAGEASVQVLIPPKKPIELGDVRFVEWGTTRLRGDLRGCLGVEITGDKTVDLRGFDIATERFCSAGQFKNLNNSVFTITGFASWSPHGIGESKNQPSQPRGGKINLTAKKPWKLNVNFKVNHIYSDETKYRPFQITKATISNLDASGGEQIVAKGCTDGGGNKNVKFVP